VRMRRAAYDVKFAGMQVSQLVCVDEQSGIVAIVSSAEILKCLLCAAH